MADFIIPDSLAHELEVLAEQEKRSVPELLKMMLERYQTSTSVDGDIDISDDPLLRMAEIAKADRLVFTGDNVAARSREILEAEYADYLLKRMRGEDADT
jgi:rRNA-processing protein FCF1